MRTWSYEIRDNTTDEILKTDFGFETESDAELQAMMEAKADNIKGYYIRTFQPPYDDEN